MKTRITRTVAICLLLCCVLLTACDGGTTASPTPAVGETSSPALSLSPSSSPDPSPSSPAPPVILKPEEATLEDINNYCNYYKQPFGSKVLDMPTISMEDLLFNNADGFLNQLIGVDYSYYRETGAGIGLSVDMLIYYHPTQAIRYNQNYSNNTYVYFPYDLDNGMRFFNFYDMQLDVEYNEVISDWISTRSMHYCVLMAKKLSYLDFIPLKKGDSIDLVAEIDPIIPVYQRTFDQYGEGYITAMGLNRLTSMHLLTDGILKIEYTRDKQGRYWIETLTNSEDFTLENPYSLEHDIIDAPCYRIDPQDYVD